MQTHRFAAGDLITSHTMPPKAGNPSWLDQQFRARRDADKAALGGGGVYGIFVRGALVYIGKYAGSTDNAFGGNALTDRWLKHMSTITMRGRVLSIGAGVPTMLAERSEEPWHALAVAAADLHAGIWKQNHMTSPRKIAWAAANWSFLGGAFGPVLDAIEIVYVRVEPDTNDPRHAKPAMNTWLDPIETGLIAHFAPPLNSAGNAAPEAESADVATFVAAANTAIKGANGEALDAADALVVSDDDLRDERDLFLEHLNAGARAALATIEEDAATEGVFSYFALNGQELRLGVEGRKRHHPTVIVERGRRGAHVGQFKVRTKASADAIRAAGFAPEPSGDVPMPQRFACPPTADAARRLVTLAKDALPD